MAADYCWISSRTYTLNGNDKTYSLVLFTVLGLHYSHQGAVPLFQTGGLILMQPRLLRKLLNCERKSREKVFSIEPCKIRRVKLETEVKFLKGNQQIKNSRGNM